jgi:hypothetical protein
MAEVIKRTSVTQALKLTVLFVGGALWQEKQPHTASFVEWIFI